MVLLESMKIRMGEEAPQFSLACIDGKTYSLKDFSSAKVLVVAFICNHCPYAQAVWPRLVDLHKKYQDVSVGFVAINPNVGNPYYPEETLPLMKEYAGKFLMIFPYLADPTQEVARAYQAQCTPDIFAYDVDRKLRYHGRVDDNWKDASKVTKHDLDEAISLLLKGELPGEEQHPAMGCSIKWRSESVEKMTLASLERNKTAKPYE